MPHVRARTAPGRALIAQDLGSYAGAVIRSKVHAAKYMGHPV